MLEFLSSLFSSRDEERDRPDQALLEAAVERVVDGTDPRLRGFLNYRERLIDSVEKTVVYVIDFVDGLPGPVEISRNSFGEDPRIRTFFATAGQIGELCGGSNNVTEFLDGHRGLLPERIYTLLTMELHEHRRPGMVLQGGKVRRDVMQTVVEFGNHRCLGPTGSETKTRRELKKRAFDLIVQQALERIIEERGKRHNLRQQSRLLNRKLAAMKSGDWGLEPMLGHLETAHPDRGALTAEIGRIEGELEGMDSTPHTLEHTFDCINRVFDNPASHLWKQRIELDLGPMLVKVSDPAAKGVVHLELDEVHLGTGHRRIVQLGWFPAGELPERKDFLSEARRYL